MSLNTALDNKYKNIKNLYLKSNPLFQFIINAAIAYIVWLLFYNVIRYIPIIENFYTNGTYYITASFLYATQGFLDLIGYDSIVYLQKKTIIMEGTNGVFLEKGCLGRNLFGLFTGFILVYPGIIKSKLWYIPLGIVVIYILNILRIAGLSLVLLYYPEYIDINHHIVFTYTVYAFIFIMWVIWVKKYGVTSSKKVEN